nr:diacylglycerol kinase family lipid kinase [Anaerolineae bacterium]
MLRYKVIANPLAGNGAGERAIPQVERILSGYGLDFDVVRTERPWHAADLAQEAIAAGYDAVVALGGDGTSNEVLNGLMRAKTFIPDPSSYEREGRKMCAMGVLCVGTGNDFAYGMGIPLDLEEGCRALARGRTRWIDVGRVAGMRYFGNGIGIGFDAVVSLQARRLTRVRGFLRYFLAVLRTLLFYYHAPLTTIQADEQTIVQPTLMTSVMNGRRMGGGFLMAPEATPDDGFFDFCIAAKMNRLQMLSFVPRFIRGTQVGKKRITMGRARRVVVTCEESGLVAHADGETLCLDAHRLELELLPRQIEVIC